MSGKFSQTGDKKRYLPNCIVRSETNQRDNNEDSFQILDLVQTLGRSPITLLAVADGMGGHAYGEEVSRETLRKVSLVLFEQLTVESSLNRLEEVPPIEAKTLSKALINALEMANAHIQRMVKNNKWGNAGSTIVIAAILENIAVVAYLGDSPMFHYQSNYRHIEKITEDHTVAGVLLRAKMITPEMARYHEGRGRLEFYVGCPNLPREVPVHQIALTPGDLLLLCSDGVSGSVSEEQIANIFAENGGNLELAAEELLDLGRRAGETDNQTLILWRHQGNKESASDPSWQEDSLAESRDRQERQASQIQTQSSDVNRHQKQQKSGFDSVVQDSSSAEWQGDRQQQQASQTQSQPIGAWTPDRQQQTEFKTVVQDSHQSSENPELETQKTRRNR